jgi:hypothetical protein
MALVQMFILIYQSYKILEICVFYVVLVSYMRSVLMGECTVFANRLVSWLFKDIVGMEII